MALKCHILSASHKIPIIFEMADPPPNEGGEPIPDNVGKRELTLLQKNAIIKDLLGRFKNEGESIELRRGALSAVAKKKISRSIDYQKNLDSCKREL